MNSALLLIALGFGFKIFAEASEKQKKSIKQLGRIVGIIMMIVSLCGVLCTVVSCIQGSGCGRTSAYCPLHISHKGDMITSDGYHGMKMGKKFCPIMDTTESEPAVIHEKKEK